MVVFSEPPILFPENLLHAQQKANCRWWVLMTKARHEKTVARRLLGWRMPYCLPLVRRTAQRDGREVTSAMPLFPGCVFLFGTSQDRRVSQQTAEVRHVAAVRDSAGMFRDLRFVHRLITYEEPLTIESRLPPGRRVRVREGPLAGIEGTAFVRRGESRLLVAVRSLGRGASIALEGILVEPLDSGRGRLPGVRPADQQTKGQQL